MPIPTEVYRGDGRAPDILEGDRGFSAWSPLTIDEAREMVQLFTRLRSLNQCSFKDRGQRVILPDVVRGDPDSLHTPDSLKELIIRSGRSRESFWVSTETTQGGGGMGGGYIYEIPTANLQLVSWDRVNVDLRPRQLWPELYTDTGDLDNANAIALYNAMGDTKELSYLTNITCPQIQGWKLASADPSEPFAPTGW